MKSLALIFTSMTMILSTTSMAADSNPKVALTPATLETQCITARANAVRRRLVLAILENRDKAFAYEAKLNQIEQAIFSTISQSNEPDSEESYLNRLRAALPREASYCARIDLLKRPPVY